MEKYLRKCLDSLIVSEETMKLLEVLVINDGSKDLSSAIAHEYESKYPNTFRVIDKENGNYGSCINRGLKEATGKYFRILDSDDWFDTIQFKLFLTHLLRNEADVIMSNYSKIYNEKTYLISYPSTFNSGMVYKIDDLSYNVKELSQMLVMHALTFRTSLLKYINLDLQHGISYTDIEYCYFPMAKAKTISFIAANLYHYYLGRDGQTMQKKVLIRNIFDLEKVATRVLKDYLNQGDIRGWRNKALIDIIVNPVYQIYVIYLVYLRRPSYQYKSVFYMVNELVSHNYCLKYFVNRMTYRKIPFVWIWRNLHFRLGLICGR